MQYYSVFVDTLLYAMNFTFDPLTLKVRCIKRHVIEVCTKFERNWAIRSQIIDNFAIFLHTFCPAVTLTFDLLALNFDGTSGVMRLNSVQNLSEIE